MPKTQTAESHASVDPMFMSAGLVAVLNVILSLYITIRDWPIHSRSHLWWIVMSIAFVAALIRVRAYATKNQDRIIRLEERFRYAAILPTAELSRAAALFAAADHCPPLRIGLRAARADRAHAKPGPYAQADQEKHHGLAARLPAGLRFVR